MFRKYVLLAFVSLAYIFSDNLYRQVRVRKQMFELDVIDVGQGDAILITSNKGRRVLVDGGDGYDLDAYINKVTPVPFCRIDFIIMTHTHADHWEGLDRIMKRCDVRVFTFNDVASDSATYLKFVQNIPENKKLKLYSDSKIKVDNIIITILWPDIAVLKTQELSSDANFLSTVALVSYRDFDILLTGDAPAGVLDKIWAEKESMLQNDKVDVFKVPHHGSITGLSEKFLTNLSPTYCVISVGEGNSYGLPDEDVLSFLAEIKCEVYRTDSDGNIEFKAK